MNSFTPLTTTLLDLAHELRVASVPLTIGGGFGLYLKQLRLRESGERTLLTILPEPRATNDIDLFLRAEIVASLKSMQLVSRALQTLGFEAVENAKYLQWRRQLEIDEVEQEVKLDLLVGPLGEHAETLKTDKPPRVRPKGNVRLHAFRTEEALEIDNESQSLVVRGRLSDGTEHQSEVFIPHGFTYLMMKLFAFDDRKHDVQKDVGRHHAMDLYRTVGMFTEPEYQRALKLADMFSSDERTARARSIVQDQFQTATSLGNLRLREHSLYQDDFQVAEFISVLREVFPTKTSQ